MKKKDKKEVQNFFSVDFSPNDANYVLDIYKYLVKKT